MSQRTTSDGIRHSYCLRVAEQAGVRIRDGGGHRYILNYGDMRPCPLAASTNAETMLAPWLARATGRKKREVYEALRQGDWNN